MNIKTATTLTSLLILGATLITTIGGNSACGGDVAIGRGSSSLDNGGTSGANSSGDASANATPSGGLGADPAGHCNDGACAPAQTGDCPMTKCADYQTGCAYGKMVHLRCVPDPNAGHGSAPADQCTLVGDCTNANFPTSGGECPESECGSVPKCTFGRPVKKGCVSLGPDGGPNQICAWNFTCEAP